MNMQIKHFTGAQHFTKHLIDIDNDVIEFNFYGTPGKPILFYSPGMLVATHKEMLEISSILSSNFESLIEKYQIVTFNQPGIGSSTTNCKEYSTKKIAERLLQCFEILSIESIELAIGYAYGGNIVQWLGIISNELIKKIVFINSWARPLAKQDLDLEDAFTARTWLEQLDNSIIDCQKEMFKTCFNNNITNEGEYDYIFRKKIETSPYINKDSIMKLFNGSLEHDVYNQLHKIEVPTLMVVGKKDALVPKECAEDFLAKISSCELVEFDGGHILDYEVMEQVSRIILDF